MRNIKKAVDIIKKWEGYRSKAYKDPVGIWTIGYGTIRYPGGSKVNKGDTTTKTNAEKFLMDHIKESILEQLDKALKVTINDNQYSALVSFTYNLGIGNLRKSTLLKKINNGDFFGAAREFNKWVKAGGKTLKGLVRRRAEERKLFEKPIDSIVSSKDPTTNTKEVVTFWAKIRNLIQAFINKLLRK